MHRLERADVTERDHLLLLPTFQRRHTFLLMLIFPIVHTTYTFLLTKNISTRGPRRRETLTLLQVAGAVACFKMK